VAARFNAGETTVRYEHGVGYAEATLADGMVVGADGYLAEPRYWARLARLFIIAEEPTDLEAEGIRGGSSQYGRRRAGCAGRV
jgi:hypothetical protein